MTVILSSHILPEIEVTCDRVLIINQGRVVATGTPGELRREILGHSLYHLEIAGDLSALSTALTHFEPTLKITEQTKPDPTGFSNLQLTTSRDDSIGEALLRLLASDPRYRVRGLTRRHPSLEEVFLAATRRTWEKTDTPQKR
jgi:ABC-2 type transport system ATP-binding protein